MIFASDHGLAGGSGGPGEPRTSEIVEALIRGEAPLATFARAAGMELQVVDCGVSDTLADGPGLVSRKFALGTGDVRRGPAMRVEQAHAALELGMEMGDRCEGFGVACVGLGRGADISAALTIAGLTRRDFTEFVDPPPSPSESSSTDPSDALSAALVAARQTSDPVELLAALGGFETAAMAGCILALASRRRLIVVDGLAASAALLAAAHIAPAVVDYCLFARSRTSATVDRSLGLFGASSLVELGLEALDGTGSTLAWPLIERAGLLLSDASAPPIGDDEASRRKVRRS